MIWKDIANGVLFAMRRNSSYVMALMSGTAYEPRNAGRSV